MFLSDVSVKRPTMAIVLSLLLCVFGYVSFTKLSIREYPDVSIPRVSVSTSYSGASAAIMESQVTTPLEEQLSGISGIDQITSTSRNGNSSINITFEIGHNLDEGASDVRDAVARAKRSLPEDANDPIVSKANSSGDEIMYLMVTSTVMDRTELTDYLNRALIDRFNLITGVSSIRISGGMDKVMYVKLDPTAMAGLGVTTSDISNALSTENVENPSGEIRNDTTSMTVRTTRNYNTAEDFNYLVVHKSDDGHPIYLREVAEVYLGARNESSMYKNSGKVGVSMGVTGQSDANPLEVAQAIRKEVDNIQKFLPKGTELAIAYDATAFIERSISEVYSTLLMTGILVVLILYLFLGQFRATLIPAVTVPVSLIAAFMAAYALGFSINLITLLALILAIGLVVDDAIVVVENIFHHLEKGESPLVAAFKGTREVGFAVIATTVVLVMVFLPISFMEGMVGLFFTEFSILLAVSVIFSSVIALTLTPVMGSKLLRAQGEPNALTKYVDNLFQKVEGVYKKILEKALALKFLAPVAIIVFIIGSGILMKLTPAQFAPQQDQGVLIAYVKGADATSFNRMSQNAEEIERRLMPFLEKGYFKSFSIEAPAFGGRAGDETAFAIMVLQDWGDRDESAQEILTMVNEALKGMTDVRVFARMPGFGGGSSEPVGFVLNGSDYPTLLKYAEEIRVRAEADGYISGGDVDYSEKTPELVVSIDKQRAAELGVSVSTISETLNIMLGGSNRTTYLERGEEYDIYLRGDEDSFNNVNDLSKIYIRSDDGELVTLDSVTNIQEVASASRLSHTNKQKAITLTASLAGEYTLGEALDHLDEIAIDVLPSDITISYSGESKDFKENQSSTFVVFGLAMLVAYLVLAAQFESFINPLVVMFTVPMGVFGGFFGLLILGQSLNIYSQLGMIMLIGMVTKNGILIVEFANQLRDQGMAFEKAVVEASTRRLRPIMMTAFTTIIGAFPLILSRGAGFESRVAVGTVILFGMAFATLVTLIIIPQMYGLISANTKSPGYVEGLLNQQLEQEVVKEKA